MRNIMPNRLFLLIVFLALVSTGCGTRTVFITSAGFTGNLGGLPGADAQCQTLADAAGLSGTYLAWLSTNDGTSPATRFTQASVPYVRVDGQVVAKNFVDLTDGSIISPINLDEKGSDRSTGARPWTGTSSAGVPQGANCSGWKESTTGGGQAGLQTATDSRWSADDGTPLVPCKNAQRIYCFEQ